MIKALYIGRVLLNALILIFSFQMFRVFMLTVIWNLSYYLPGPYSLALFALAVFACVMLLPFIVRLAGTRGIIAVSGFGIVIMRMAMQFASEPVYLLILSTAGIVMFMWFFTAWIRSGLDFDRQYPPVMATAFPIAILMDVCSRSLLMSYDLVWRKNTWALMTIAGASLLILILLWLTAVRGKNFGEEGEPGFLRSLLVTGIGPWLYLGMTIYQNPAAAVGHAGISDMQMNIIICIITALGAFSGTFIALRPQKLRFAIAFPLSLILILSTWGIVESKGSVIYLIYAGALAMWMLPGFILAAGPEKKHGIYGTSLGMFLGFIIMLVLIFLHSNSGIFSMTIAASVIISIVAIAASLLQIETVSWKNVKAGLSIAGISCIVAIGALDLMMLKSSSPSTYWVFPGNNIRVLTYNIHQGLDADGVMNLEGIIGEIKKLNPDIVCLQEVNRAQVSNGLVDCLMPVSHALGMPYVFGANSDDGQYGNAILTRYPVRDWDNLKFFNNSTETRGTLHAVIKTRQPNDMGSDLNVFVTHLDHIAGPSNVREKQAREVIEFFSKRPRTIIAGDLNAEPDTAEMKPFYAEELKDALEPFGKKYVKTFWEGYGERAMKLDYIFISKDLVAVDAIIDDSRASDHKPVAIDIRR
ncbi:MAG TPA: endonuclease/exonuclease/phosphatase family protein [Desulfomonilia bacterium]